MADQKISELLAALALDGTELVPIVQGGVTKQTTIADIVIWGTPKVLTAASGSYVLTGTDTVTVGGELLAGETDAVGMDFTYTDVTKQLYISDLTTPANNYNGDPVSKLIYDSPDVKITRRANGLWTQSTVGQLPYEWDVAGQLLGLRLEDSRTNLCLQSSDFTNASWTKSNMTTSKTATGPDGVSNSATILTASAGNATALQAIVSGSASRISSMFVKRRTGSGTVNITQDNGSTWTAVTVTAGWTRVESTNQTTTNPTVGIRIVTSGDAVDVALFQHELGEFITSPIATTTVTVTRAGDHLSLTAFPVAANGPASAVWEGTLSSITISAQHVLTIDDGASLESVFFRPDSNPTFRLRIHANGGNVEDNFSAGSATADTIMKFGAAWNTNDSAAVLNGGTVFTGDGTSTLPTGLTTLQIMRRAGGEPATGYCRKITYLKRRITNAELQTRTT